MPSTSNSGFEPDFIDPAVKRELLHNSEGVHTWDRFSALMRHYGIMYHDQHEGGPALIGLPLPQPPACRVIRPGPTTDPEKLFHALLAAVANEPAMFPTVDSLKADVKALGVEVLGLSHGVHDIEDCKEFTAKLWRVAEPEPLEATYYPHALAEAKAKYASLYLIDVYYSAEGKFLNAVDHRKTAGLAIDGASAEATGRRANLIDALQRKIMLKLLAPVIANGMHHLNHYQPPIWRIMDEPLPQPTA